MSEKNIIQKLEQLEKLITNQSLLQKPILNFQETCLYLEISASYLYKLTSRKEIPHFCPNGKKLYFNRAELDNWLSRNRMASNAEIEVQAATYVTNKKR
ncbi:MAG: helix-turn-helix domain-containing protein [Patescibacteria group bacterium]